MLTLIIPVLHSIFHVDIGGMYYVLPVLLDIAIIVRVGDV